jgi:hypothetical protein
MEVDAEPVYTNDTSVKRQKTEPKGILAKLADADATHPYTPPLPLSSPSSLLPPLPFRALEDDKKSIIRASNLYSRGLPSSLSTYDEQASVLQNLPKNTEPVKESIAQLQEREASVLRQAQRLLLSCSMQNLDTYVLLCDETPELQHFSARQHSHFVVFCTWANIPLFVAFCAVTRDPDKPALDVVHLLSTQTWLTQSLRVGGVLGKTTIHFAWKLGLKQIIWPRSFAFFCTMKGNRRHRFGPKTMDHLLRGTWQIFDPRSQQVPQTMLPDNSHIDLESTDAMLTVFRMISREPRVETDFHLENLPECKPIDNTWPRVIKWLEGDQVRAFVEVCVTAQNDAYVAVDISEGQEEAFTVFLDHLIPCLRQFFNASGKLHMFVLTNVDGIVENTTARFKLAHSELSDELKQFFPPEDADEDDNEERKYTWSRCSGDLSEYKLDPQCPYFQDEEQLILSRVISDSQFNFDMQFILGWAVAVQHQRRSVISNSLVPGNDVEEITDALEIDREVVRFLAEDEIEGVDGVDGSDEKEDGSSEVAEEIQNTFITNTVVDGPDSLIKAFEVNRKLDTEGDRELINVRPSGHEFTPEQCDRKVSLVCDEVLDVWSNLDVNLSVKNEYTQRLKRSASSIACRLWEICVADPFAVSHCGWLKFQGIAFPNTTHFPSSTQIDEFFKWVDEQCYRAGKRMKFGQPVILSVKPHGVNLPLGDLGVELEQPAFFPLNRDTMNAEWSLPETIRFISVRIPESLRSEYSPTRDEKALTSPLAPTNDFAYAFPFNAFVSLRYGTKFEQPQFRFINVNKALYHYGFFAPLPNTFYSTECAARICEMTLRTGVIPFVTSGNPPARICSAVGDSTNRDGSVYAHEYHPDEPIVITTCPLCERYISYTNNSITENLPIIFCKQFTCEVFGSPTMLLDTLLRARGQPKAVFTHDPFSIHHYYMMKLPRVHREKPDLFSSAWNCPPEPDDLTTTNKLTELMWYNPSAYVTYYTKLRWAPIPSDVDQKAATMVRELALARDRVAVKTWTLSNFIRDIACFMATHQHATTEYNKNLSVVKTALDAKVKEKTLSESWRDVHRTIVLFMSAPTTSLKWWTNVSTLDALNRDGPVTLVTGIKAVAEQLDWLQTMDFELYRDTCCLPSLIQLTHSIHTTLLELLRNRYVKEVAKPEPFFRSIVATITRDFRAHLVTLLTPVADIMTTAKQYYLDARRRTLLPVEEMFVVSKQAANSETLFDIKSLVAAIEKQQGLAALAPHVQKIISSVFSDPSPSQTALAAKKFMEDACDSLWQEQTTSTLENEVRGHSIRFANQLLEPAYDASKQITFDEKKDSEAFFVSVECRPIVTRYLTFPTNGNTDEIEEIIFQTLAAIELALAPDRIWVERYQQLLLLDTNEKTENESDEEFANRSRIKSAYQTEKILLGLFPGVNSRWQEMTKKLEPLVVAPGQTRISDSYLATAKQIRHDASARVQEIWKPAEFSMTTWNTILSHNAQVCADLQIRRSALKRCNATQPLPQEEKDFQSWRAQTEAAAVDHINDAIKRLAWANLFLPFSLSAYHILHGRSWYQSLFPDRIAVGSREDWETRDPDEVGPREDRETRDPDEEPTPFDLKMNPHNSLPLNLSITYALDVTTTTAIKDVSTLGTLIFGDRDAAEFPDAIEYLKDTAKSIQQKILEKQPPGATRDQETASIVAAANENLPIVDNTSTRWPLVATPHRKLRQVVSEVSSADAHEDQYRMKRFGSLVDAPRRPDFLASAPLINTDNATYASRTQALIEAISRTQLSYTDTAESKLKLRSRLSAIPSKMPPGFFPDDLSEAQRALSQWLCDQPLDSEAENAVLSEYRFTPGFYQAQSIQEEAIRLTRNPEQKDCSALAVIGATIASSAVDSTQVLTLDNYLATGSTEYLPREGDDAEEATARWLDWLSIVSAMWRIYLAILDDLTPDGNPRVGEDPSFNHRLARDARVLLPASVLASFNSLCETTVKSNEGRLSALTAMLFRSARDRVTCAIMHHLPCMVLMAWIQRTRVNLTKSQEEIRKFLESKEHSLRDSFRQLASTTRLDTLDLAIPRHQDPRTFAEVAALYVLGERSSFRRVESNGALQTLFVQLAGHTKGLQALWAQPISFRDACIALCSKVLRAREHALRKTGLNREGLYNEHVVHHASLPTQEHLNEMTEILSSNTGAHVLLTARKQAIQRTKETWANVKNLRDKLLDQTALSCAEWQYILTSFIEWSDVLGLLLTRVDDAAGQILPAGLSYRVSKRDIGSFAPVPIQEWLVNLAVYAISRDDWVPREWAWNPSWGTDFSVYLGIIRAVWQAKASSVFKGWKPLEAPINEDVEFSQDFFIRTTDATFYIQTVNGQETLVIAQDDEKFASREMFELSVGDAPRSVLTDLPDLLFISRQRGVPDVIHGWDKAFNYYLFYAGSTTSTQRANEVITWLENANKHLSQLIHNATSLSDGTSQTFVKQNFTVPMEVSAIAYEDVSGMEIYEEENSQIKHRSKRGRDNDATEEKEASPSDSYGLIDLSEEQPVFVLEKEEEQEQEQEQEEQEQEQERKQRRRRTRRKRKEEKKREGGRK